jgi:mevalonate kinase
MQGAVERIESALKESDGFEELSGGISLAGRCFQNWGLVNPPLAATLNQLLIRGATAAKPTGSGLGGYVLSLWNSEDKIPKEAIRVG